jgi:hypothetical protein
MKYSCIIDDTQRKLDSIMLSERSHSQTVTYYMILFIGNVWNWKIHKDRKWIIAHQGLCGDNEE